jgi:hypothetical protein
MLCPWHITTGGIDNAFTLCSRLKFLGGLEDSTIRQRSSWMQPKGVYELGELRISPESLCLYVMLLKCQRAQQKKSIYRVNSKPSVAL